MRKQRSKSKAVLRKYQPTHTAGWLKKLRKDIHQMKTRKR